MQVAGMNTHSVIGGRHAGYAAAPRKQTAACRLSTRVLRTDTSQPKSAENGTPAGDSTRKTVTGTLEEDWVWTKSQTKITVFSGAQV